MPDARFSDVARRYRIAERVLFRWKHEANQAAAPGFVAVRITDANAPFDTALSDEERVP